MFKHLFYLGSFIFLVGCGAKSTDSTDNEGSETVNEEKTTINKKPLAKFEPEDGQVILFAGQELDAIGGLDEYNNGYYDHFDAPGGFTMYTNFRPGDTVHGHINKGLDGLMTTDDWGDGPSNMQMQIDDPDFNNSALAIGLELVNHDENVAKGVHDSIIIKFGNWIKGLGKRPVFLRTGFEWDGHDWNHYDKEFHKQSFIRVRQILDSMGVENVAFVWQSKGWGSTYKEIEEWYPGDEYVDWCGVSFFSRYQGIEPMLLFSKEHGKPLFIAEASPSIEADSNDYQPIDLADPKWSQYAWDNWFVHFFKLIDENPDVVKAVSYINCNWKSHRMWKSVPNFAQMDARLQLSEDLSNKWKEITGKEQYLKASPDLFDKLWNNNKE